MNPIQSWKWWRHNHYMPVWASLKMVFRTTIVWPLKEVYAWIWLKVNYRWGKLPWSKMYKLHKSISELEKDLFEDNNAKRSRTRKPLG